MPRPQLILPQADASCGKVFFSDRRTADGHRIALEVWNRATGRTREGYALAVFRCKRCGGFHLGQKPVSRIRMRTLNVPYENPDEDQRQSLDDWEYTAPLPRTISLSETAWS
jgi:hypothetical protein